eukprot:PhF_6_TR7010/c0_g1_i1/m.10419
MTVCCVALLIKAINLIKLITHTQHTAYEILKKRSETTTKTTRRGIMYKISTQCAIRLWISDDGLPRKHQARFLRFRFLNPHCRFILVTDVQHLPTPTCDFARNISMEIMDVREIPTFDETEEIIKCHVLKEIEAYFQHPPNFPLRGNLSVVADQVRLLSWTLASGIFSDCDVDFAQPLPLEPVYKSLLVRYKEVGEEGNVIVSNDIVAGDPQHPVFCRARELTRNFNESFNSFFSTFAPRHGCIQQFSYCQGPLLFARAMGDIGIQVGSNVSVLKDGVLVAKPNQPLRFTDYELPSHYWCSRDVVDAEFHLSCDMKASWDHSWVPGHVSWKVLSWREELRLHLFTCGVALKNIPALEHFICVIPRNRLSLCRILLDRLVFPSPPHRRALSYAELTPQIQKYVQRNETPNESFRSQLLSIMTSDEQTACKRLKNEGVIVVSQYLEGETLARLQEAFEREIRKKKADPILSMISFNISVDDDVDTDLVTLCARLGQDPVLASIMQYHFGNKVKLVAMRGYRQFNTETLHFRAWDYHQDLKSKGPFGEIKIMIILTDLTKEGQAMRYVKGSHLHHWYADTMKYTKFTLQDALQFGNGVDVCYGKAGSLVLFDTNGIHSGHRNAQGIRDVITISFTPQTPDMIEMFSSKLVKLCYDSTTLATNHLQRSICLQNDADCLTDIPSLLAEYNKAHTATRQRIPRRDVMKSISWDLNCDLDLPLRDIVADDKDRDNSLVKLRDVSADDQRYVRLRNRLRCVLGEAISPPELGDLIEKTHTLISSVTCSLWKQLADDFCEALHRLDSVQRLRSQLIFLYFLCDAQCEEERRFVPDPNIYLKWYSSIVRIDDSLCCEKLFAR